MAINIIIRVIVEGRRGQPAGWNTPGNTTFDCMTDSDVISHSCKCHRLSLVLAVLRRGILSADPRQGFECKCFEYRQFDVSTTESYIRMQESGQVNRTDVLLALL